MDECRRLGLTAAVIGGLLGATFVWLNRPEPPGCTTLDNGMRACMPVYVAEPPLWIYVAFALAGALVASGMALGYAVARCAREA